MSADARAWAWASTVVSVIHIAVALVCAYGAIWVADNDLAWRLGATGFVALMIAVATGAFAAVAWEESQ